MLLYLFGNWCCIGAAALVINFYWRGGTSRSTDILVSRDCIKMLALGSVLRAYWSMSPPPIWYDEVDVIQDIAVLRGRERREIIMIHEDHRSICEYLCDRTSAPVTW